MSEVTADQEVKFNPDTIEEALKAWDAGVPLSVVEMGGIGPGYEQALQILVMEILRETVKREFVLPKEGEIPEEIKKQYQELINSVVDRIDEKKVGGFSGAQVGAAGSVCCNYLKRGWREFIEEVKKKDANRLIMICSFWPQK